MTMQLCRQNLRLLFRQNLYRLSKTVAIGCAAGCGRVGRSIGSNEVTAKAGATKPVAMSNAVRNE